ncbi:MAG TPA: peptidoglycan DD-metalloendopeptidase family protein [Devosiaceae bacterium]
MPNSSRASVTTALLRLSVAALALCGPAIALAQDAEQPAHTEDPADVLPADPGLDPQSAEKARNELESIQNSITLSKERAAALRAEIEKLDGDRTRQNAALIAAAQRVKAAETDVSAIEEKLGGLLREEADVKARLDGADSNISALLAALERIGENPPPALIVNPDDAVGSARSALVLSAVLPQLRDRASKVAADLKRLAELKSAAQAQETELKANLTTLQEEQLRIATLIEARKQSLSEANSALQAEEQQAEELAGRAGSLKELIASLESRISAVTKAAEAARAANAGRSTPTLSPETVRLALANTARTAPAVPFSAARGYLARPVNGVTVTGFGASDGFGGTSAGESVVTRGEAQVLAPADGWVMYKGPYLDYGQIVILNPGQGFTILLAGLETVSVDLGQFVMMGEPVGAMGRRTLGQTVATNAGVSQPTLYIEFRNNDKPIDPEDWWATDNNATQSG